jgi:hypothetical protein
MFTTRNRVLLAKEESIYNTDSTPVVATNAIEASNVKLNITPELLTRDNVRSNISPVAPVIGKRMYDLTFTVELKGSGTKGTASRIGDLFEACAFAETASAGSSVIYLPTSTGKKSCTIYLYDNDTSSAVLHKLTGCIGDITAIRAPAGQYASIDFAFKGNYVADADVALPSAPTYESTVPPVVESSTYTFGGVATLIVQELTLSMGNVIGERDDINSPNGVKAFEITAREPKGTMNPEAVSVATMPITANMVASTQNALSVVIGSVAGNKCTITAPKCVIESVSDGEREGFLTRDVPFRLGQNAGNDEIQFKFE